MQMCTRRYEVVTWITDAGMDGYSATPGAEGEAHLLAGPSLALTAHALRRGQKSLEAAAQPHLTKPSAKRRSHASERTPGAR